MNYLEICQEICGECGISGGYAVPTTVVSQTGELARIVRHAKKAYTEIQNRHKWRWLRHGFTVETTADDDSYAYTDCTDTTSSAAIDRFSGWRFEDRRDPPKIYLTSSGVGTETWLTVIPWDSFKALYRIGTQNSGYPAHITVDPQNNLVLGPKPDAAYTVSGDFYRSAQQLAVDADTPEMPSQFHDLIVYRAKKKYGYFESAQEVIGISHEEARMLMRQLEINQLPHPRLGSPMA